MLPLIRKNYFNKLFAVDLNCKQRLKKTIRSLSTLQAEVIDYKNERREFLAVAPDVLRSLTEYASKYQTKDAVQLYEKALQYNVMGKRQQGGVATVLAYKEFADKTQLNLENIKLAHYLGWCVEMVQSSGIIFDDIQDGSVTRDGQPCWYMFEDVKLKAMNDSLMILSGAFHILKEHFAQKDYYVKLLDLFHEVIFIGKLGECMDVQASKNSVDSFTTDRYKLIAANKTTYFGPYLPIALAMHLCGVTDSDVYRKTKAIVLELGQIGQVLNDFNDCFGDPDETGKIGSDIQENKCSWLAVLCMEKASETQKEIMRECYGKSDPVKIAQVKHLYKELGLPDIITAYREEAFNKIITQSQQDLGSVQSRIYKIFAPLLSSEARADLIGSSNV